MDTERRERVRIARDTPWRELAFLSWEVRERLDAARPETLGQVARLPGFTPAAVNAVARWVATR